MTLSSYEKPYGALWNAVPLFSQYPHRFPLDSWGLNPWQPLLTLCRNVQSYLLYPIIIFLTMVFVLCGCPPSLNINLTLKRQEYIFNYTKLWVSNVVFTALHVGLYNWKRNVEKCVVQLYYVEWVNLSLKSTVQSAYPSALQLPSRVVLMCMWTHSHTYNQYTAAWHLSCGSPATHIIIILLTWRSADAFVRSL